MNPASAFPAACSIGIPYGATGLESANIINEKRIEDSSPLAAGSFNLPGKDDKLMDTQLFSTYFLPITLGIIMLGIGLSITRTDLKNILSQPKNLVTGLLCQLFLLPVIAFSICFFTNLRPEFKVGLVIISACPGGVTSNLVNYIIKTNVALCVSITVINGVITLVTIPLVTRLALYVFLGHDTEFHLPVADTILKIFLLTVLPVTGGILLRAKYLGLAIRLENPLRMILPFLLLAVYAGVIFLENGGAESTRFSSFSTLFFPAFLLNILSMGAGLTVSRMAGLIKRNQVTIAVEVGLQNSTLAIFVASTLLNSAEMSVVAVVYGSFSFFSTILLGFMAKRYL